MVARQRPCPGARIMNNNNNNNYRRSSHSRDCRRLDWSTMGVDSRCRDHVDRNGSSDCNVGKNSARMGRYVRHFHLFLWLRGWRRVSYDEHSSNGKSR